VSFVIIYRQEGCSAVAVVANCTQPSIHYSCCL